MKTPATHPLGDLFGVTAEQQPWALAETYGPPKPLTLEDFQRGFEVLKQRMKDPPPERIRYISHARYQLCQEAIADGASEYEVLLISIGYSREAAREASKK